ncbi:MAG: metalloprotease, partial [Bacteroidia bacterium]|nr:metalloprotease [Bacteroidia bacterium]
MIRKLTYYLIFCSTILANGQNKINLIADFDIEQKEICIKQYIEYFNTTNDTLYDIYLTDWNNSFSNKNTPLALRFAEEYNASFHFAKNEERGFTSITSIQNQDKEELYYFRLEEQQDIVKVTLAKPLLPNQSYKISLDYNVFIPSSKFTLYGVSGLNEFRLKYWYITPASYNGTWQLFSNKNLDDSFIPKANISLKVKYPGNYIITTELDEIKTNEKEKIKTSEFYGEDRVDTRLYLQKSPSMKTTQTDRFAILSDIQDKNLRNIEKAILADRVARFIEIKLGKYPHKKLLVTEIDVKKNPIYGLNQLPDFIRPFPEFFHYELKLLKNTISNYLDNVLLINPRKEHWLKDGIESYYLMMYIEDYYPDIKLIGNLANIWGIRSFHAADLKFNEQYGLFYMHMARTNRDQPLTTPKDSLIKFNNDLGNKFKAGVGLKYLDAYINNNI